MFPSQRNQIGVHWGLMQCRVLPCVLPPGLQDLLHDLLVLLTAVPVRSLHGEVLLSQPDHGITHH